MTQNVGRLGVVLALDTAEFTAGLQKAQKTVLNFANTAIPNMAAAGVAAFTAMTYKALSFADAISDVAAANDIAISSILHLSEGLAQSGGEAKNAGKLLASFTSQIDAAAQGSKTAQDMFARIGISLGDIGKMSNEDLFGKTLQALSKIDDAVTRNAIAFQVFGKAVKGVDIKALAEEMSKNTEEFEKYSDAIKLAGELHDKLDAKATKTMVLFTNTFIPAINTVYDSMNKGGSAFQSFMEFGGEAFKGLIYGARTLVTILQTINAAVNLTALSLKAITTGNAGDIPELYKQYDEYVGKLRKEDKEFARNLMTPAKAAVKGTGTAGRPTKEAPSDELTKAKEISAEYARQAQMEYDKLVRQGEMLTLTNNERALKEAIYKVEDDRDKKLADIQKKIDEATAKGADKKVIDALEAQKVAVQQLSDAYIQLTMSETMAQQEAQQSFNVGWEKAFNQYVEDAKNGAKTAADMFKAMTTSMEDAIANFVKTGKFSFKDFAKTIIAEIINIQARAIAAKASSSILGSIPWESIFGGSTDFLGSSALGANASAGTKLGISTGSTNLQMRASGGSISAGEPYIVGERGPELVIPNSSGTVIPNSRLSDVSGKGESNVTNYYIDAIDTKSFEQRILGSSNAVWAANQYANNKTLATSRSRT